MSGPAAAVDPADDPALDEGILAAAPVLEFNGCTAVARLGGLSVLPWRRPYLEALALGIAADAHPPRDRGFPQSLVRIQRGRSATEADLAAATAALAADGLLVVTGANTLGIAAWIRRVGDVLGGPPLRSHHRAKAKVAVFACLGHRCAAPSVERSPLAAGDARTLVVEPGVFSPGELDAGTEVLLGVLAKRPAVARVADLGCGAGHLGIGCLLAWPGASAVFLDADARAVASARENLRELGIAERGRAEWWDASEMVPGGPFDLILINPPAHEGAEVSLAAARAMFRGAAAALAPGGRMLIVANKRLPYERDLTAFGGCRDIEELNGFKVLECGGGDG